MVNQATSVRWEYYVLEVNADIHLLKPSQFAKGQIADQLNKLGAEGWELVGVVNAAVGVTAGPLLYHFKREIE